MVFLVLSLYWFPGAADAQCQTSPAPPFPPARVCQALRFYLRKVAASKQLLLQSVAIRERNDRKVMPRKAAGFAVLFAHGRTAQAAPTRENEPRSESFVAT